MDKFDLPVWSSDDVTSLLLIDFDAATGITNLLKFLIQNKGYVKDSTMDLMFVISSVAATAFLGGWQSPFPNFLNTPAWSVFWMISKAFFLVFVMIWVRWTVPRLRVDQLMHLCWKVFIPIGLFNIFGVSIWTVLRG